ncbi:MAG: hypothetical protein WBE32_10835 [Pseudolabrys sp.]|jgi:hypothetical protein
MSRLERAPVSFDDAAPLADGIVAKVGKTIVLALPNPVRLGQKQTLQGAPILFLAE